MRAARQVRSWLVAGCIAVLTSACSTVPANENALLTGSATWRERMALPEGAVFEATLEDVSRADAPADVIGSVRIDAPTAPPIHFSIPYDPTRIEATHRYSVRARILHRDQLMFTTDTAYPVLTQGAPDTVELLLRRAGSGARAPGRNLLSGMYSYAADAGWFIECGTRRRLPVAQESDNAALEAAYDRTPHAPFEALLATVEGRVEDREQMEGPVRPTLIVDRFISVGPGRCEDGGTAALENTYWKVTSIRGVPVETMEGQREPHLILHPEDRRVSGHGGCNSMAGSYETEADRISFRQMATTMMACMRGMEQEKALHEALGSVVRWQIAGQRLQLLDRENAVLLEAESRDLR